MIYQHGSSEAGKMIANDLDVMINAVRNDPEDGDGPAGLPVPA